MEENKQYSYNDLEEMKDLYEIRKTLRFGLSLNSKKIQNTHLEFKELIEISLKRIEEIKKENLIKNEKDLIEKIKKFVNNLKNQLDLWSKIYNRFDVISVTKEYYRKLEKDARFEGFWDDKKYDKKTKKSKTIKQPSSNEITLSSLFKEYENKKRRDYIINFWKELIEKNKYFLSIFEFSLIQYENAINNSNLAHEKPNLIDFRKSFLRVLNVSNKWLNPIRLQSILFSKINNSKDNESNNLIKKFVSLNSERINLRDLGEELRIYFQENGNLVPFAKLSLNYYTATQKPNKFEEDIENQIKKIGLVEFVKNKYNKSFNDDEKKYSKFLNPKELPLIEKIRLFKPKAIPASIIYHLAENISKKTGIDERDVFKNLESVGTPVDIPNDYKQYNVNRINEFDLNFYPLKSAFDYVWENYSKFLIDRIKENDFPKKECEKFLEKFGLCLDDPNLILYAQLSYIKDELANLEYKNPNDEKPIIENINKLFAQVIFPNDEKKYYTGHNKSLEEHKTVILNWIKKPKEERNSNDNNFIDAKIKIGLFRGGLKNKDKYYELTQKFKVLASNFGQACAELREKFNEETNLTKISHYGLIVEDSANHKYLLALPLENKENKKTDDEIKNRVDILENKLNDLGNFKTYKVVSFTSKTLNKMLKNWKGYKEFHFTAEEIEKYKQLGEKNFEGQFRDKTNLIKEFKKNFHLKDSKNKKELLLHLKGCLYHSHMAKEQKWKEKFNWDFQSCKEYVDYEKEVDKKGYILEENKKISFEDVKNLIKNENCLLFPIVNQDILSGRDDSNNQFTKDWNSMFLKNKNYRLHPEVELFYQKPTENYKSKAKLGDRFARFQIKGNFGMEYVPQIKNSLNKKEQKEILSKKERQEKEIEVFNGKIINRFSKLNQYYVFGIDRGIKQLATLCVRDNLGKIQDFEIYKRDFDCNLEQHKYCFLEKRGILDLTNLRVETDPNSKEQKLVDLSLIPVVDNENPIKRKLRVKDSENKQNIKLKELAYIRKLQYQMSFNEDKVLNNIKELDFDDPTQIEKVVKTLIIPYKEGEQYSDLPLKKLGFMLKSFKKLKEDKSLSEIEKVNLMQMTTELDASEDLKRGVVANMVGVINFLLKKFNYNCLISLEDLSNAWYFQKDGLSGDNIRNTKSDPDMDLKKQDNLVLAGVGTYHFFEMQLLKKLFKIQQGKEILHLVPNFRNVKNYSEISKYDNPFSHRPFGIVYFINPKYTSSKCPVCGNTKTKGKDNLKINRNTKGVNIFSCKKCEYISVWDENQFENLQAKNPYTKEEVEKIIKKNKEKIKKKEKEKFNLEFIKNGDDNGAYHIAEKTNKIIQYKIKWKIT